MHTSFTTDFLYILHLNRSTQLLLKMQYYLSNIYFITVFCKFVCQDKLDVLGIKRISRCQISLLTICNLLNMFRVYLRLLQKISSILNEVLN